jgi:flagellar hook-basal body complex protein FliE
MVGGLMATKEQAKSLTDLISKALEYYNNNLLSRSEWGAINFNGAANDLERAKNILSYLNILPLESLPDNAINQITQAINQVTPILDQINKFSITNGNPTGTRDGIQSSLHGQVDNFYSQTASWIPFLAYQKGDVAENIKKLTDALNQAQKLIEQTKTDIDKDKAEIDRIIVATREASASAGAAVFTKDFENESDAQEKSAGKWLLATGASVLLTVGAAIVMWVHAESKTAADLTNSQVIQTVAAKLVILTMFVTGTMWLGRQYKALRHLTTLNRHRSLSLRTLKAFSAAASDEQTKNAVLIEVTRAVFQANQTGYLDGQSGDESPTKIIEIAKVLSGKTPAT